MSATTDWSLTESGFERLLTALDAERDRAAGAYEDMRRRTIGLLRWWGAANAEELADTAIDRVARKLQAGAAIPAAALGAYVRGVARMVLYESRRRDERLRKSALVAAPVASSEPETGRLLDALDERLDAISPSERQILLGYYADGRNSANRRRLAKELGISDTALRTRAHRLRVRLENALRAYS